MFWLLVGVFSHLGQWEGNEVFIKVHSKSLGDGHVEESFFFDYNYLCKNVMNIIRIIWVIQIILCSLLIHPLRTGSHPPLGPQIQAVIRKNLHRCNSQHFSIDCPRDPITLSNNDWGV